MKKNADPYKVRENAEMRETERKKIEDVTIESLTNLETYRVVLLSNDSFLKHREAILFCLIANFGQFIRAEVLCDKTQNLTGKRKSQTYESLKKLKETGVLAVQKNAPKTGRAKNYVINEDVYAKMKASVLQLLES